MTVWTINFEIGENMNIVHSHGDCNMKSPSHSHKHFNIFTVRKAQK